MDGLPTRESYPGLVVMPGSAAEVREVVRLLHLTGTPFVARGAGTGLSGGAVADPDAVLVALTRLNRILGVDPARRRATLQPGVVNARLSEAVAPFGLHYVPDPSSQAACTVGGNVAENAGGPHCLKYGVTTNHVVELEVVLPDASVVRLGSRQGEPWGPDLVGLFVGSEGMFGIATEIVVRLEPIPAAVRTLLADFPTVRQASEAVSAIIGTGIVPAALEMMDRACVQAVEASIYAAGYPTDAAAVLLVELDGGADAVEADSATVAGIPRAAAHARCGAPPPRPTAPGSGRAGRRRSARWAGSRPTSRCRTRWSRAPPCPTSWTGSRRSAAVTGSRSATSFTPETGICTPTSASTAATRRWPSGCRWPAARSWPRASRREAASPESTGWDPTRSTTCR
jgi:FAD/FMN-containing dehydrogenase